MSYENSLDRREFTLRSAMAILSGVAITITGCSDGADESSGAPPSTGSPTFPATPTPGTASDRTGLVSANHGHSAVITGAQLTAGNALSLDIRGGADHPHKVELSAAEIVRIRDGQRVFKDSSTDLSHRHTVTFN